MSDAAVSASNSGPGVGIALLAILGVVFLGEALTFARVFFIGMIAIGAIGLHAFE